NPINPAATLKLRRLSQRKMKVVAVQLRRIMKNNKKKHSIKKGFKHEALFNTIQRKVKENGYYLQEIAIGHRVTYFHSAFKNSRNYLLVHICITIYNDIELEGGVLLW